MKKMFLVWACALSSTLVSAQSRWTITPEAGITAVQRVNGTDWRPGVKVGASIGYQFKPGWIALKTGLHYTNRGYSEPDLPQTITFEDGRSAFGLVGGSITQHFLQLPVMADFSWKVGSNVRMHLAAGMYVAASLSNHWDWGSSFWQYHSAPEALTKAGYVGPYYGQYDFGYGHHYEYSYDEDPFSEHSHLDWGITSSFGIEVQNWVINLGYDLSLGDEGDDFVRKSDLWEGMTCRSVGANFNTLSLSVGYKFKLGK